jgi:hypothetical protein
VDTGEGLPGEVAQLSSGRTMGLWVLGNGGDWPSTDWGRRKIRGPPAAAQRHAN